MIRIAPVVATSALLAACGGVQIRPDPVIPKAIIEPLQTDVGVIVGNDMRNFKTEETRWGSDWKIDLGPGHLHLVEQMFKAAFRNSREFTDLDSARAASGLTALFEPRIEQYSFATARETGGRYYAVTVRYRINMYTPAGELADSFTLTGYGNALAKGMSSGKPLAFASVGAMRDAAAKFLVQFPSQPAGIRLARNEAIVVATKVTGPAMADAAGIEAVPIEESTPDRRSAAPAAALGPPPGSTPPASTPQPPVPDATAPPATPSPVDSAPASTPPPAAAAPDHPSPSAQPPPSPQH